MSGRLINILICSLITWIGLLQAQDSVLEINDLGAEQIRYAGFILNKERTVQIKAVGAGGENKLTHLNSHQSDPNNMYAYAWILNSETREMVWRMTINNTRKVRWTEYNRKFNGKVRLPEGTYEVYFSTVEPFFISTDGGFVSFNQLLRKVLGTEDDWDKEAEQWMIRISGVDEVLDERDVEKEQTAWLNKTIIHLVNQKDDSFEKRGFTLTQPAQLQIYALGEGFNGKMFDYGWIIEADSHERIWMMDEKKTEYAGGARKNRMIKKTIDFKPGNYLVYFKTDDSHSATEWNANPPYDPFFWGIVVKPAEKDFNWKKVEKYEEKKQKVVASITRVGDYAYREAFIEVKKPTKVRIFALGEGRSGEMFDYGWISRAEDGKIVWKMNYEETRHAGGSSKNRLYDGTILLEPGIYIVHYQSDDSHSYEEWNARPPQQPEMWGITVYNLGDKNAISKIDRLQAKQKNILAQLTQVGDDEYLRKDFYLDKKTQIRIYCIGEGDPDEMYDYGWIKNKDDGEIVWKMRYKNTVHAGGAKKNRMVDTIISLPAGNYRVYYRSDGSHSYRHWNARPPYDERNWGITIYRLE